MPRIGLALSGGGIRSATFCIGLMRGLAQNGILRRFDYLSTVSGGGYAGSVFGRLVSTFGIDKAEKTFAAGDSVVLTWLRRYGRYLAPAGARDFGMLIATYMRSAIAVHLEIGLLAILIGLVVAAPHAVLPRWVSLDEASWHGWQTFWWPLALAVWLACGPALMTAYWNVRRKWNTRIDANVADGFAWKPLVGLIAVTVAVVFWANAASVDYLQQPIHRLPPLAPLLAITANGTLAALLWVLLSANKEGTTGVTEFIAEQRNGLTRALRFVNKLALMLACLGLLDFACWSLLDWHRFRSASGDPGNWLVGGLSVGAVLAIILRAFAEPLQKLANAPDSAASRWIPRLINIAGLSVGVMLLGAWALLVQWLVFDDSSWSLLDNLTAVQRICVLVGALVIWFAITLRNRETVNASSLHSFYRARLIRAYLSVGNEKRFKHAPLAVKSVGPGDPPPRTAAMVDSMLGSVTDYEAGDDVPLRKYTPEASGGPIHLVCGCINQTIDDRSKLFNADRKGAAIVASARAIEVGLNDPNLAADDVELGTLGHWVATSGAAAAPGAGSNTTSGWALLMFLVGARLGYWLDSLTLDSNKPPVRVEGEASADSQPSSRLTKLLNRIVDWGREWWRKAAPSQTKPALLLTEALAWFAGRKKRWWYLSDGGHFDNTGVYALLRRELDCIVLADCGADPKFEFNDLENLIRKARIDFDADIEFYTRREVAGIFPTSDAHLQVLALEDMKDNTSARGVLLARICYHSSNPRLRKIGSLLVVKPNLHEALDRDLLAYAARNKSFPQQSTGDQFFDEAQWESYHRLGHDFGRAMTSTWLRHVPGWRVGVECPMPLLPLRRVSLLDAASKANAVPFWRSGMAATALGTGIGLGAFGTVLLTGWQVIETIQKTKREQVSLATDKDNAALVLAAAIEPSISKAISALQTHRICLALASDQATSPSQCASPESLDINPIEGDKLRQMYSFWSGGSVARNGAVYTMIAEVQRACVADNGVCASDLNLPYRLCSTTCEPPRIPSSYWLPPAVASDWRRNPAVVWTNDMAQSVFGEMPMAHDQLATNSGPDPTPMPAVPESGADAISAESTELPPMLDAPPSAITPTPPQSPTSADDIAVSQSDYDLWLRQQQAQASSQQSMNAQSDQSYAQRQDRNHNNFQASIRPTPAPETFNPPVEDAADATPEASEPEVENRPVAVPVTAGNFPNCHIAGKPVTIYAQIFDESQRTTLKQLGRKWLGPEARNENAVVAGIENVVETALQRGSTPPRSYRTPTMIVHDERDKDCATALAAALQKDFDGIYRSSDAGYVSIRSLPSSLASATPRRVIELWMPTPPVPAGK